MSKYAEFEEIRCRSDTLPSMSRLETSAIWMIQVKQTYSPVFIMAAEKEFESFLQSINLAEDYLERFNASGFNDIELVKSLELDEQRQMFDLVGLSGKPGHLLKFKKAIASYTRNLGSINIDNSNQTAVPAQKKAQKSKFLSL